MYVPIQFIRLDFSVQSVLIALNTLLIACTPFNLSILIYVLLLQLVIGGYQFLTAIVHYIRPMLSPTIKQWRALHLLVSVFSVGTLIISAFSGVDGTRSFGNYGSAIAFWLLLLGIPQITAYSYYFLTRLDYKSRANYLKNRAGFSS